MTGRIVILNGAPRSGKSTLARAIQAEGGAWINWGVDAFNATLPPSLLPGIGLRPGGERLDLEPQVKRLYGAYFDVLGALARSGLDVVADLGMHRDYAVPFDPFEVMDERLTGLTVLVVGVDCELDVVVSRRRSQYDDRHIAQGAEIPEPVRRWQTIHRGRRYDLRLDMGRLEPRDGARAILRRLEQFATPLSI